MQISKVQFTPTAPKMKRVCAYARVSTGKDAMLHSLAAQIDYYSTLIRHHAGWEYVGVYADEAQTGTRDNRKQFQRMIADAKASKIDLIITKSISRFARNTLTLLSTVRDLKAIGVDVFFEEQNVHTISAEGELMLTLLASFAQEESLSISENLKWRIRKNFEAGIPWGGTMLGYRFENGKYVVIPEDVPVIRFIFDEYLAGKGLQAIANELNEMGAVTRFGNTHWDDTAVRAILCNYTYTGNLLLQKTYREDHLTKHRRFNGGELPRYHVEGAHEAIIDKDTFDAVRAEMELRRDHFYNGTNPPVCYPLSGKIVCGICGKHYRHRPGKWICSTYKKHGKSACPSKLIPDAVVDAITEEYDEIDHITALPGNELIITLPDGSEHRHAWQDRSRAESWTPEMKEKARQRTKAQRSKEHAKKRNSNPGD